MLQGLEVQVAARTHELSAKVDAEAANIVHYQQILDGYDGEAHDLVGHVAERNFGLVRDKLRGIVLRADVGITEQAWEVREEEASRVRNLQGERSREEQLLSEELREVVELKVFADLTFREISEVTGLAQGTVATRYRSALEKMRHQMVKESQ